MSTKNAAELDKFLRLNLAKSVKSKNKSKQRKNATRTKSGII
jgi:hypothetical protein